LIIFEAGDFGIVGTHETIELSPKYAARIGLRSAYSRRGFVASTGPQIDPGFRGRLFIGLINLGPRPLPVAYLDPFCTLEFHELSEPVEKPYSGPYQDEITIPASQIEFLIAHEGLAFSQVLTTLSTLSANVAALSSDVSTLKWSIPIITGLGIAIIAVLVAFRG